ncbi:hypothetical protein ACJRO7_012725 [Eucalyptus globulus]|uniref:Uncharacterized protein n=1 Tax=Eucalyptus globulus TaxID=34317 RepID=A0ABD3LKQ6_EUCGL
MASLSSCFVLPCKFKTLSLSASFSPTPPHSRIAFKTLSLNASFSLEITSTTAFRSDAYPRLFSSRSLVSDGEKNPPRFSVVRDAAPTKRARQAERRRVHKKAGESEIRTQMKKISSPGLGEACLATSGAGRREARLATSELAEPCLGLASSLDWLPAMAANGGGWERIATAQLKKKKREENSWF